MAVSDWLSESVDGSFAPICVLMSPVRAGFDVQQVRVNKVAWRDGEMPHFKVPPIVQRVISAEQASVEHTGEPVSFRFSTPLPRVRLGSGPKGPAKIQYLANFCGFHPIKSRCIYIHIGFCEFLRASKARTSRNCGFCGSKIF